MYQNLEATESERKRRAEARLNHRVQLAAKQQQAVIQQVMQVVIVDKLVDPRAMYFIVQDDTILLGYNRHDEVPAKTIHNHALGQMASVSGLPRAYASRLRDGQGWEKLLLAHNLNELFLKGEYRDRKGTPSKFLHRLVGDQVRGFLSSRYNRKLLTKPLLKAFVQSCATYQAGPIEAVTNDIQTSLKCVVPIVFEPVDGEFVAFGVTFANSDFGAGKAKVSGTVMRISSGTISVLQDEFSRVHLSSVIEESDVEISAETQDAELKAHQSGINDAVKSILSAENIDRSLKAIQVAHEEKIPWYKLKNQLSKVLLKAELETVEQLLKGGSDIIDLPPASTDKDGEAMATGWWASNVLGWMANKTTDADKKQALQAMGGALIAA